ncbi:peptidase U32 family protein [Treponema bryantii]|uniref:peptidase U32 family protein n=1 Tax=Treponema bryantii TaxID=163 RepID=UPI0003B2F05A|nr:U32 family peptidase [Treponema bryantii]
MELLSPAGNVEKLYYAYAYGADAAYIGLKKFSLRVKADNFYEDEYKKVQALKEKFPGRRLHCALNISFHDEEIDALKANLDYFKQYPIDAFIVQDIGIVPLLQKEFPNAQLHLSTQASCVNSEAVKMYKSLGFSRIVLGREISIEQIRRIKDAVPDMELETFVHGAMCIAYAGRCLMSAYLTGRSAQSGFCSHTCRWNFKVDGKACAENLEAARALAQSGLLTLEEEQRPGEKFPVFEGDGFTAILSSKDLRMIEHLADLRDAGVDSLKIEGRMKSVYYVAMVTRAYRKALDALEGKLSQEEAAPYIAELDNVAHRESTTGFYYDKSNADETTTGASDSKYQLAAEIGEEITGAAFDKLYTEGHARYDAAQKELEAMHPAAREARLKDYEVHPDRRIISFEKKEGWHMYDCKGMNMIRAGEVIEFVSPEFCSLKVPADEWEIIDSETGLKMNWTCDGHPTALYLKHKLPDGTLLRTLDPDYVEGKIRDTGR